MIKPDQIPDEVVEALHTSLADDAGVLVPKGDCVAAIAAALTAWPGVFLYPMNKTRLVLPLPQGAAAPQEARDE